VANRDVSARAVADESRRFRRRLVYLAGALALLAIGIAIGNRLSQSGERGSAASVATPSASERTDGASRPRARSRTQRASAHTREGAVAAAVRAVTAFNGEVLLQPSRLRAVVTSISSAQSRADLLTAFEQASNQTRTKLGAATVPRPVIVLRSVPAGYQLERFAHDKATVAVWYVGIVGSGAEVEPQQSWRTQIVRLVWQEGAWKVSSFESSPGPTPPLSTAEAVEPPGELFAAIPRFRDLQRAGL
jgi:hypothetical protein